MRSFDLMLIFYMGFIALIAGMFVVMVFLPMYTVPSGMPRCSVVRTYITSQGLRVYNSTYSAGGFGSWTTITLSPQGLVAIARQNSTQVILFYRNEVGPLGMFYIEDAPATLYRTQCVA
jgi:hypothetical protein